MKQRIEVTHQPVLPEHESKRTDVGVDTGDKLSQIYHMVISIITSLTHYNKETKEAIQDEIANYYLRFQKSLCTA